MDSRIETLLKALLNGDSVEDFEPQSRAEHYLKNCILQLGADGLPDPQSRLDALLYELAIKMPEMGGAELPTQTKTITPSTSEQSVSPDGGYKLTKVIVEAVTNAVDDNIKAENIKEGVSILGVAGTEKGYDAGKLAERKAFWDKFQDYGARNDYDRAFNTRYWTDDIFYPQHDIVTIGESIQIFYGSYITDLRGRLAEQGVIFDTSRATILNGIFYSSKITALPVLDVGQCIDFISTFGCHKLIEIDGILNIKEEATFNGSCFDCSYLQNIKEITGTIGTTIRLATCKDLNAATTRRFIKCLKNYANTDQVGVNSFLLQDRTWNFVDDTTADDYEAPPSEATWKDYVSSLGWST